jgi:hypothetical protein
MYTKCVWYFLAETINKIIVNDMSTVCGNVRDHDVNGQGISRESTKNNIKGERGKGSPKM